MHFYTLYHIDLYHRFPYSGRVHFPKLNVMILLSNMFFCKVVWTLLHQEVESIPFPLYLGFFKVFWSTECSSSGILGLPRPDRGGLWFLVPSLAHSPLGTHHWVLPLGIHPQAKAHGKTSCRCSAQFSSWVACWQPASPASPCEWVRPAVYNGMRDPKQEPHNWAQLNHRAMRDNHQLLFGATKLWDGLLQSDRDLETYLRKVPKILSFIIHLFI